MPMAASSITPNSSTRLKPETPSSHLSSKLVDLGFHSKSISLKKKKPAIQCAIDFPFPKQPYQKPLIPKDTPKKPQPPHWNPLQGALATAIDTLEHALLSLELQHPLPKTIDPRVQLAGNFAPVPEHPVRHSLPVTGTIPECINGVYLRNGPNPFFHPVAGHHFFDGDGMVHAVAITGGAASYACRFTETQKLVQERKLNRPLFPKPIGELHGGAGLVRLVALLLRRAFGIVDGGTGTANTGLVFFDGRVLAMSEDDLPYELRVTPSGDLRTVGLYTFGNQLNSSMIAHPKIDPESGELFALSYDVLRPKIRYFRFSPEGKKSQEVDVTLPAPTMVHDFAITENFVVVPDQQVVFKVEEMVKSRSPLMLDRTKKPRFGILPKYTENENDIVWVESPDDTFCFHLCNAWEERETNEVVVIASCMNSPGSIFMDNDDNGDERFKSVLCEIRLNLETRESTRRPIVLEEEHVNLEMGMVSRHVLGRKTRYAYLAIADPWPKVSGFAKVDMVTGEVRKHYHGDGRFGGEPFFLARGKHGDGDGDEDDGYVMVLVHDEGTCMSELQIVNAVDLELEATVMLPSRVPYGFHGIFVDAKDLAKQPCH